MHANFNGHSFLFVLPWSLAHVGGVNQVVINLAREMCRHKSFKPVVLISDWEAVDPIWEVVHGIRTVRWRLRSYSSNMSIKEHIAFAIWELRFQPAFRRFCEENKVAVVNPHYAGSTAFTLQRIISRLKLRIPLIISFHGADLTSITSSQNNTVKEWRQLLTKVKATVACSRDLANRLVDSFGEEVLPTVVHNGIDIASFTALATDSKPMYGRYVLSVGKFEEKKGHDVLVKAFAAIAEDYDDLNLVLLGATGNQIPELKKLCAEEGVSDRVHLLIDIPHCEVAAYFRHASFFVLPSRQEPFGIVLLEAGCFCLPVVASRVGGIPEILYDDLTGRLVTPDNPDELALALRSLLDNPETAQALGKQLYAHVKETFTWEAAHEKYLMLI